MERLEDLLPKALADNNFPNAGRFIQRRLSAGRLLLLLDGLDEVDSVEQHGHVIQLVQEFAGQAHELNNGQSKTSKSGEEGNIIVVSCRTYSYGHGEQLVGFTKTMVMDFDDVAIDSFIRNWFDSEAARPLADELLAALTGNRRFLELARNPLLLLLITAHYERERNLPDQRAELYNDCIETRISSWNTRRGTHYGRFGRADKRRLLRELALYLYTEQGRTPVIDEDRLLDWVEIFAGGLNLPDESSHVDLLEDVVRTSGLVQERAIGRYGFSHLTLQEYFVAEGASRLGPEEGAALLGKHLDDPRWQEVILLYCGLADNADPLLRRIVGLAELDAEGGGDGRRAWLQGGQCLAEGARNVDVEISRQIADALFDLVRRAESSADPNLESTVLAGAEVGDPVVESGPPLTADESAQALEQLRSLAAADLSSYVRTLLDSSDDDDALLAARLITDTADDELKDKVAKHLRSLYVANIDQRRVAATALGHIASADATTIAALHAGLEDPDAGARTEAVRALARLKVADDVTIAKLLHLHNHEPAENARHAALHALLALGAASEVGMIHVPAGEFLMGSADSDKQAEPNEKPQHRVHLPAYYIDRTPVTNRQFRRFVEAGGYANQVFWAEAIEAKRWRNGIFVDYDNTERRRPYFWDDSRWNGDEQPVVGVSWYESLAYARWTGKRLPSEAEWEKAVRWDAEQQRSLLYPWGDRWIEGRANTEDAGIKRTTPVGQFSPDGDSPIGAVDMAGNAWEWCSTRWGFDYPYSAIDGREDLTGGDKIGRVVRGGSWFNDRKLGRCASRDWVNPWYLCPNGGLRCVRATSSPLLGSDS